MCYPACRWSIPSPDVCCSPAVYSFASAAAAAVISAAAAAAAICCCIRPAVEFGQEVAVVGAAESLGNWDVEKSIAMSWNDGDFWTAQAELPVG
jgi:hypothetical protein